MDSPFVCPRCRAALNYGEETYVCPSCEIIYPVTGGIPDFRSKDEYWCNVDRPTMKRLCSRAEECGNWDQAAQELIPEYKGHFDSFDRADAQLLWPSDSDSVILDAGSMWGGLTIPAAQFHGKVFAVDKTLETLSFLSIRARQMGLKNIITAGASVDRLPFSDCFFDLVILNGVLEWVGMDEEIVLKRDFGKKKEDRKAYKTDPRLMQLTALKEIYRVLKKGGHLFLAIENRIGYTYLRGDPDDHVNLKYVSLMPRILADIVTRHKINSDYRTYTYSPHGYKKMLEEAGFAKSFFYGAFNHYMRADKLVPFQLIGKMREKIMPRRGRKTRLFFRCMPERWLKHFSPSILALAVKEPGIQYKYVPRLINLLSRTGMKSEAFEDSMAMKIESRSTSSLPVNYLIIKNKASSPHLFLKVSRTWENRAELSREFDNLEKANQIVDKTSFPGSIPKPLYYGIVDNFPLLATNYLEAEPIGFQPNDRLSSVKWGVIEWQIKKALDFLIEFQMAGRSAAVDASQYILSLLESYINQLETQAPENGIVEDLVFLQEELRQLDTFELPLVPVHGDFCFFYNLKFNKDRIAVFDFEHFETSGLPFRDLAPLLLDLPLVSRDFRSKEKSLQEILTMPEWEKRIKEWLHFYSSQSGIAKTWLTFLLPLAALDYKYRQYPESRDPDTFLLNKNIVFKEALKIRLDL